MNKQHPWCGWVVDRIRCFYVVISAAVLGLVEIHDKGKFGKKAMLYASFYLTWVACKWGFEYTVARSNSTDGTGTALIIGAVLTPTLSLTGFIFKFYLGDSADARRVEAAIPTTESTQTSSLKTTG